MRTGGVDTLEGSLYGAWDWHWEKTRKQLSEAKAEAVASQDNVAWIEGPDGDFLQVMAYGSRGQRAAWVLVWRGCRISIVDRQEEHETSPSVMVSIPGTMCLAKGVEWAWARLVEVLKSFGFRYSRSVCSRIDAAVDFVGVGVGDIVDAYYSGRFITKARTDAAIWLHSRKRTGLTVGRSDVVVRCYDKLHEVTKAKRDEAKEALMIQNRWGGVLPAKATRVEIQVRGPVLKQMNFATCEAAIENVAAVARYVLNDWFRLTEDIPDSENNNQTRSKTSRLWQGVQAAFAEVYGETEAVKRKYERAAPKAEGARRLALGALTTWAVVHGVRSLGEFLAFARDQLSGDFADKICEMIERKRKVLEVGPPVWKIGNPFGLSFADDDSEWVAQGVF